MTQKEETFFFEKKNQKTFMSWFDIIRLGVVQATLGCVVVFTTVTLNRVMVVELALPAALPGTLVALHYILQVLRPRLGFGSDLGGRRTPWIIGGMALLAGGGIAAAAATTVMAHNLPLGIALAVAAYTAIGIGVGAAGTTVLVLMAKQVAPERRGAAATIVWVMMIFGIVLTSIVTSQILHPFSLSVLLITAAKLSGSAFIIACLAVWRIEPREAATPTPAAAQQPFLTALGEIWREQRARRFALFVFLSMLAYGAQELILEPFAGAIFGLTPAQTAGLTGLQHGGVMAGMLLVGIGSLLIGKSRVQAMRFWTIGGCIGSSLALLALAFAGFAGTLWALKPVLAVLGIANGAFAVSAIGAMMGLAAEGAGTRAGVRMGLWGAAQALAFGAGSLLGPGASDLFKILLGSPAPAYAAVFCCQAFLFLAAARLAGGIFDTDTRSAKLSGGVSQFKEIAA
jgi:BCD family chlorophyll transporter-like MFS transporter